MEGKEIKKREREREKEEGGGGERRGRGRERARREKTRAQRERQKKENKSCIPVLTWIFFIQGYTMGCLDAVLLGWSGFGWLQAGGAGEGVVEVVDKAACSQSCCAFSERCCWPPAVCPWPLWLPAACWILPQLNWRSGKEGRGTGYSSGW